MAADELRRRRHGAQVTFVRVADVPLDQALAGEVAWEGTPGEIRIVGVPADLDQAVRAVAAVTASAGAVPVTAFRSTTSNGQRGRASPRARGSSR